jgi:predicted AAA+ superfamily ATPase
LHFRNCTPILLGILKRIITHKLEKAIKYNPAVALLGARQIGKTTLAHEISKNRTSIYLDLESPQDLLKLSDASSFFLSNSDKFIILDGIQRLPDIFMPDIFMPDIFMILRGVIDKNRRAGHKNGNFLLLGSASMDLLRQSSESLAGKN